MGLSPSFESESVMTKNPEILVFDPVQYSIPENLFLLDQLGKPTIVAMREVGPKVNAATVKPVLDRINDLEAQRNHSGVEWIGVEAVKEAIKTYLEQYNRWTQDKRRGRPRFPSMYAFDGRRRGFLGGPGSDSGQVRTYFKPDGTRERFDVPLFPDGNTDWTPDWSNEQVIPTNLKEVTLVVDRESNRIECPVCKHTETFKADSESSFRAARARMSKHLRADKSLTAASHLEVYSNEFRS